MTGDQEAKQNGVELPVKMEIKVFGGANGNFELYEDDGVSTAYRQGQFAITNFDFLWNNGNDTLFTIRPSSLQICGMSKRRQYTIAFTGICDKDSISVTVGDSLVSYSKEYNSKLKAIILTLPLCDIGSSITVRFSDKLVLANNCPRKRIFELLNSAQIGYELKENIYKCVCTASNPGSAICELQSMNLSQNLLGAISEILFAQ
jgi:hypothetical protein